MESILKDALSGGVLRDEISILLIGKEGTFAECLEEAVKLDSAYRARSTIKEGDKVSLSVLKSEIAPPELLSDNPVLQFQHVPAQANVSFPPTNNATGSYYTNDQGLQFGISPILIVCYNCQRTGHIASRCPLREPRHSAPRSSRNINLSCHFCGIQSHLMRECRKRARYLRTQQQSGSLAHELTQHPEHPTERPYQHNPLGQVQPRYNRQNLPAHSQSNPSYEGRQ